MKDLDDSYANKDFQKRIKEMSGYVDTLKFQNGDHYTYLILASNAKDMEELSGTLSRMAPDSYFRRMVNRLGEQSGQLHAASARKSQIATEAAIEQILKTWAIIEEYKKPS
jgi:muconolactone delta-isomerase